MTGRRVLVIGSHPLFLKSLRVLLDRPEIEWVGISNDAEDLPARVTALQPDVVVLEGEVSENAKKLYKY